MSTLTAPQLVTNRDQARRLTSSLPDDLSACVVEVDCSGMKASTPSFVDELVKQVLVARRAAELRLVDAPQRTNELAHKFAGNHGVAANLATVSRLPSA